MKVRAGIVVVLAALTSCAHSQQAVVRHGSSPTSALSVTSPSVAGTPAVPAALNWKAPAVAEGAEAIDGSSFAGRPVALWFWAPW